MNIVDLNLAGAGDRKTAERSIPHPQNASSPLELCLLLLIAGLAAVLRFHSLAAKSFWFDEGVSVAIARLDWYNFARLLWRREANMSLTIFFFTFGCTLEGPDFLFAPCQFFLRLPLSQSSTGWGSVSLTHELV